MRSLLEPDLPSGAEVIARGRKMVRDWPLQPGAFLKEMDVPSESAFKRQALASGRIMQHAQVGFRDKEKSRRAWHEIWDSCRKNGVTVDRYGICLDWCMGYPRAKRDQGFVGTGMVLETPEDFVRLTAMAPVAPHFGDFVLGFPGSLETTQGVLAAGCTAIGNLGQYFTFRLPGVDDDIETTEATLTALGLIAGQEAEILVHSNLDDGFASLFTDLSSSLGAVLLEKHIVETLGGARLTHCYGNHFSDPLRRLAFHLALAEVSSNPGTMVYGNTTSYRGGPAENFASLANYLLSDILGQRFRPSGHAINPVPVTENSRIPDIDEIIDAQLFAARLTELSAAYPPMIDMSVAGKLAADIVAGGRTFFAGAMAGLAEQGVDTSDAFQMLLAIRRLGGKKLEELYGAGAADATAYRGRRPIVPGSLVEELEEMAHEQLATLAAASRSALATAKLTVLVATTDVHEHGKLLLETVFKDLSVTALDGGVSANPDELAEQAAATGADAIALSTYNGVALDYLQALKKELARRGLNVPVLIGGRLNQVPKGSNTSLPVDVTAELKAEGAIVCSEVGDAVPALLMVASARAARRAPAQKPGKRAR